MKAIIIGANGQDGFYLSKLLTREKIESLCISRKGNNVIGDVNDYKFVEQQIKKYRPNYIFHLAANSTTKHGTMFENHQTISTGTLNVLEVTRLFCPEAKVFLSGSAMQFINNGMPISETTPFEASSPYSIARIQSVYAARYFRKKFGMKVYIGYFFNHDSPFRTERHVNQIIVKTIKRISEGSNENLELGNTHVLKEFNYAADVVEAVWVLLNQDEIFETVIGCGETHSIQEWLEYCFSKINMKWQDHVIQKENFKSEYDMLVSDPTIIKGLGWKQKISFYELADLMMSY